MREPPLSVAEGRRVITNDELETTNGLLIAERHLAARLPGALGMIMGYVPGHGGDVYWVRHFEGPSSVAAYTFTEFEFVDQEQVPE